MKLKDILKIKYETFLLIIFIPILLLFLLYGIFAGGGAGLFALMSVSFLFMAPFGVGALIIYLSDIEKVKRKRYRIMMPWVPVIVFFFLTLLFSIEGWACWVMILPVFLAAASAGGLTAGYYKLKKHKNERTYVSILALLPLLISPAEQYIGSHPSIYKAYTYIDIDANKSQIWQNVTRVKAIRREQDKGWLTGSLGFPRPIRAELNYNGVGGYRKAIFEKGLVFHEEVTAYRDQQMMSFTIKANPHEIPSTTMDEHVVIGGDYFDVIDGTYELEKIGNETYRLHLYSHFKLTTTFNFYAGLWANWIMKDIQNNILQVIKQRAEGI